MQLYLCTFVSCFFYNIPLLLVMTSLAQLFVISGFTGCQMEQTLFAPVFWQLTPQFRFVLNLAGNAFDSNISQKIAFSVTLEIHSF